MNLYLNPQEIDLIKELFNMGFASAADSLSRMANCKVMTQQVSLNEMRDSRVLNLGLNSKRKVNLYTSRIKGQLDGVCFWVVGQRDSNRLSRFLLPATADKMAKQERKNLQQAMMLEIDNVITASVVTRMANLLGKTIFGMVPGGQNLNRRELEKVIREDIAELSPTLHACAKYTVVDYAIQMEFHWFLPELFGKELRKLHSQVGRTALLEKAV